MDALTYRLEFSEEQQWLRMDNYTHRAMTNGFETIADNVSDFEFRILEAYIDYYGKRKRLEKITINEILEAMDFLVGFMLRMGEYKIKIAPE